MQWRWRWLIECQGRWWKPKLDCKSMTVPYTLFPVAPFSSKMRLPSSSISFTRVHHKIGFYIDSNRHVSKHYNRGCVPSILPNSGALHKAEYLVWCKNAHSADKEERWQTWNNIRFVPSFLFSSQNTHFLFIGFIKNRVMYKQSLTIWSRHRTNCVFFVSAKSMNLRNARFTLLHNEEHNLPDYLPQGIRFLINTQCRRIRF